MSIELARDGQALHAVVVGVQAGQQTRAAAADLADYLGRITGAAFSVAAGDGRTGVAVGVAADFPAVSLGVPFDVTPVRREEYVLRSHAQGVWCVGASERAVEHAVWDLLQRLGYRLFFLTDTWEVVPTNPNPRLAIDVVERPDYITRLAPRGAPWSDNELWRRWRVRNRLESAFTLSTGHAYDQIIRDNAAEFRAHPEYFAWVGGERRLAGQVDGRGNIKFCISNPGLRKLVVDHAVRMVRAQPDLDSVSMDPSDGANWCECEPCLALGSVSDRVVTLANDVAAGINALGMGPKYVGIYAYNQHSPPPHVTVHPQVVVSVATSFIRGGYTVEQLIEGWAGRQAVLGIRDYHDVFPWSHDLPRRARGGELAYLTRTIPYFHGQGARFMNSENGDSWGANGLGYWLTPILLWDVAAADRVDEYVEDFLHKAFESASEPMREFYDLLQRDRATRTPEDVVGRMYRALAAARRLAPPAAPAAPPSGAPRNPSFKVQARLDDLVLYTRYVELYYAYQAAQGAARQAAFETLWRHVYRMSNRLLVSTVAICHRDRFRDRSVALPPEAAWDVPADQHPWKNDQPFSLDELEQMLAAGIAANPIQTLDFVPVQFSDELEPAAALNLPPVTPGEFSSRGRGTRRYLVWLQRPGALELRVTGGLIAHYRDRGNVKLRLFAAAEATLEPVASDQSVPPDGQPRHVTLRSPYAGLHTLELADGHDMTELVWPQHPPVTIVSSLDQPPHESLSGRWTLYFYVPRSAKSVGGFTTDLTGVLRDGAGESRLDFSQLPRAGYFHTPVPPGRDGQLWKIENSTGHKLLMTVPPYLARSEKDLLLPREVIAADH